MDSIRSWGLGAHRAALGASMTLFMLRFRPACHTWHATGPGPTCAARAAVVCSVHTGLPGCRERGGAWSQVLHWPLKASPLETSSSLTFAFSDVVSTSSIYKRSREHPCPVPLSRGTKLTWSYSNEVRSQALLFRNALPPRTIALTRLPSGTIVR